MTIRRYSTNMLCAMALAVGITSPLFGYAGDSFPEAPVLGVSDWLRGEPVDATKGIVIVEHWATWCAPCIEQFPHMSTLQREHADELWVVAVSDESVDTLRGFVDQRGDLMQFAVARAPAAKVRKWTAISRASSIPYSYMVKDGRIVWHGHPNGVDDVIGLVQAGIWTPVTAAKLEALPKQVEKYLRMAGRGDTAAPALGNTFAEAEWIPARDLNDLAWAILTEVPKRGRDPGLALRLSERACEATNHRNADYEDTRALAMFEVGWKAKAVAVQQEALRLCQEDGDPCSDFQRRLKQFEAASKR
jgi:thiol-disulfide isomerase/thioredoxin